MKQMKQWVLARLTVDGKVLFVTDVYVGKNGLGKKGEGAAKTPVGTLRPLNAFGIKPNPGTTMPYIDEERMVEILRNCDMSLVITVRE